MEMTGQVTEKSRTSQNTFSSNTLSRQPLSACHQSLRNAHVIYAPHNISGELDLYDRTASLKRKLDLNTKDKDACAGDYHVTLHESWSGDEYV